MENAIQKVNAMKTIAIDIRLLGKKRTGDDTVFFHLTKELLALDQKNRYLLVTDEREPSKLAILQGRLGCIGQTNVEFVPLIGKNRFVWNIFTVPWLLFHREIDIYHTQYILPFFIPERVKIVTHIHDVSFAAYPQLIGMTDRFFLSLLIPRSLRRSDLIVTPSQFTKDEIIKYYGIGRDKICVVQNAIGDEFMIHAENNKVMVTEKYHLPKRFILSLGTLQPRKNIPFLIRAFALLQKRLPDVSLVIVGSKNAHHTDTALSAALSDSRIREGILFPGYIEQNDLPAVIASATVFVFPSLYEGFGIPLLEAMSQGVAIAASEIASLKEIAGPAALYFDPLSLASCEEKLYTLFTDDFTRQTIVQKGKERLSLFSWHVSAKKLLERYNTL